MGQPYLLCSHPKQKTDIKTIRLNHKPTEDLRSRENLQFNDLPFTIFYYVILSVAKNLG